MKSFEKELELLYAKLAVKLMCKGGDEDSGRTGVGGNQDA